MSHEQIIQNVLGIKSYEKSLWYDVVISYLNKQTGRVESKTFEDISGFDVYDECGNRLLVGAPPPSDMEMVEDAYVVVDENERVVKIVLKGCLAPIRGRSD